MHEAATVKNLPRQVLEAMVHIEKMKASDGFWNELGFELEDIEYSVNELKLLTDPEM